MSAQAAMYVLVQLVDAFEQLGFGDEDADISGSDIVDCINEWFPLMKEAIKP